MNKESNFIIFCIKGYVLKKNIVNKEVVELINKNSIL